MDDEPDVEAFRQQFRRDLRAQRFIMDFAVSAADALARIAEPIEQTLILILSDSDGDNFDAGRRTGRQFGPLGSSFSLARVMKHGNTRGIGSIRNSGYIGIGYHVPSTLDEVQVTFRDNSGTQARHALDG